MRTRMLVRSVREVLAAKLLAPYHVCYVTAVDGEPCADLFGTELTRVVGSTA
jgi:hypothetical protein